MRHYGALAKAMPITFVTFAAGYLAIIGFPFFAGYYSKDHIIEAAFEHNAVIGVLALLGAGVTAFYMTRLMLMTFLGSKRWRRGVHPHESPLVMTVPLIILGIASVGGGLVLNNWIGGWLDPAVGGEHSRRGARAAALLADRRRDPGRGGGRGGDQCLAVRSPARHPAAPSRPPARRSSWPAATTCTATRSTRRCSCDPASGSPTACCGSRTPASTAR